MDANGGVYIDSQPASEKNRELILMLAYLTTLCWLTIPAAGVSASGGNENLLNDASLRGAGLITYWEANIPLPERDTVSDAYLVDDSLYVVTDSGIVYALQADVGLIRWGINVAEPDYTVYRPTHVRTADGDGPVIIPTVADFYIINRYTGDVLARFKPPFAPGGAILGHGASLYGGSLDGTFNSVLWGSLRTERPVKLWQVRVGGPITAAPVFADVESIIFASQDGTVHACSTLDKTYHWSFRVGGAISGDPAVDDNGVYIASLDRSVYKVDLDDGSLMWRLRLPALLPQGPIVASNTVFQYCPGHGLIAIDPDSGVEKWRDDSGRSFVAHIPKHDVLFTADHHLRLVDHETGKLRFAVDVSSVRQAVTNVQNDAIYLIEPAGRVVCLRPSGVPYLQPKKLNAARARLNLAPDVEARTVKPTQGSPAATDPLGDDPLRSRRDIRQ